MGFFGYLICHKRFRTLQTPKGFVAMLKSEKATQMDLKTTNIEILNKMSMTTNPNTNTNTNPINLRRGNHSVIQVIVKFVVFQFNFT
jgi:hypothetical protein